MEIQINNQQQIFQDLAPLNLLIFVILLIIN